MMFGGIEDGAKIVAEPLLDGDMTCNVEESTALVAIRFCTIAPEKLHKWTGKDKHEFDNLQYALAEAQKEMEVHGAKVLMKGFNESVRKKEPKMRRRRLGRKRNKNSDDPLATFMKAARFVRGIGAGTIHPSGKLRLFGLLMQAQRGNLPDGDIRKSIALPGLAGSALALKRLKLKAWRSEKDKSRKDAMAEYVKLVTSLAPQWKVAHFLGATKSLKDMKPRAMMWVVKITFRERSQKKSSWHQLPSGDNVRLGALSLGAASGHMNRYRVTAIEVLQSSNATGARLWTEHESVLEKGKRKGNRNGHPASADSACGGMGGEGEEEREDPEEDPFIAHMPKEWSLSDCIVDKSKFKTMEDQRAHFRERMWEMARANRDEEDGWKFYCKTNSSTLSDSEQCVS